MLAKILHRSTAGDFCESHFSPNPLTVTKPLYFFYRTREETIMVRSISVLFALIVMSGAAFAQANPEENTPEGRACRGDANRFCKADIPDQFKVGSCLQEHRDRLSRACKEALASHGM
jgi:hypothetical protein